MPYISPAYAAEPGASEWEAYLAEYCDWHEDEFQPGYAWDAPIPPREAWEEEARALNRHLATL